MSRITLEMTPLDAGVAMCEGNPGAATVCAELLKHSELGFIDLCHLDDMELYGPSLWVAYKDICNFDVTRLSEMIRDRSIKKAVEENERSDNL